MGAKRKRAVIPTEGFKGDMDGALADILPLGYRSRMVGQSDGARALTLTLGFTLILERAGAVSITLGFDAKLDRI